MSRRNQQRQASSVRVASRGVWILGIVVIAAIGGIVHSYRSRRAEILLFLASDSTRRDNGRSVRGYKKFALLVNYLSPTVFAL